MDVATGRQRLYDPNEMILGDAVGVADLLCGDDAILVRTGINQHAQGVIGMKT